MTPNMTETLNIPDIAQPALAERLQHLLDNKTKPIGSLGQLEIGRAHV